MITLKKSAIIIGGILLLLLILIAIYAQFMTGKVMTLQAQNELQMRRQLALQSQQQQTGK